MAARAETDQPQALPLCAARGDRADRKGRGVRADRHRSRQQAGLVPGDFSARQDAGAAGRRRGRDFRVRRHLRISRGDPAAPAASGRSAVPRRASRLDRVRLGRPQRYRGLLRGAGRSADSRPRTSQIEQRFARVGGARYGAGRGSTAKASRWSTRCSAPVFRYFDVFDEIGDLRHSCAASRSSRAGARRWRRGRSVRAAVSADYPALLRDFLGRAEFLDVRLAGARGRLVARRGL